MKGVTKLFPTLLIAVSTVGGALGGGYGFSQISKGQQSNLTDLVSKDLNNSSSGSRREEEEAVSEQEVSLISQKKTKTIEFKGSRVECEDISTFGLQLFKCSSPNSY